MENNTKQVLIIRTDLKNTKGEKIRTGKLIAQAAHASLGGVLQLMEKKYIDSIYTLQLKTSDPALQQWLADKFTKICVQVSSEKELLEIHKKAKEVNLNSCLIQDAGLTEFGGIPTYTCCAVGPAFNDEINKITGHLKLL